MRGIPVSSQTSDGRQVGQTSYFAAIAPYFSERCSNHFAKDRWLSPDDLPAMSDSTLMSSSSCGQWIPVPWPRKHQFERSAAVPWASRGYHPRGTEIVRPSL